MDTDKNGREGTPPFESTADANAPTIVPRDDGHSTVSWDFSDRPADPTRVDPHGVAGNGWPDDAGNSSRFGERYASYARHARGGIGCVWKAKDGLLGRYVALKEIQPKLADDLSVQRRFREEARITAGLEHPNIITMHDFSADPERPYYTMRFLDGRTIREAVLDHYSREPGTPATLDFRGLLDAFLDVCHALAFAHSRGVIHRDLKGQNIMLGPFGEVAVIDWGLARDLDSTEDPLARPTIRLEDLPAEMSRTMEGYPIGTASYMPPEQAAGRREAIGIHSDVFGLGAILYLILTGHPPYEGGDTTELVLKAKNLDFPPPSTVRPGVPPALEAVCLKAMSAEPGDRYESASALADDVRRWLADESVLAYPDTGLRAAARWARKHQPIVAGVTALLGTATVALAVSTWLIWSAWSDVDRAEINARRSFDIVQDSVPKLLEMTTDPVIARMPELLPYRRKVMMEATSVPGRLNNLAPNDPRFRLFEAKIAHHAAILEKLDDQFDAASKHLERAITLLRGLVKDGPDPAASTVELAAMLKEKASLDVSLGRYSEAAKGYREAAQLVEASTSGASPTPASLRVFAWNKVRLAYVLRETSDPRGSLDAAREALKALKSLPIALPDDKRDLADAHEAIGRALADLGSRAEAKVEFDEGVRLADERLAKDKDHPDARFDLFGALLGRAVFLASDFVPSEEAAAATDSAIKPASREAAIVDARKAIDLVERLRQQYGNASYHRRAKAYAQVVLGGLLLDKGEIDEAENLAIEAWDEMQRMVHRNPRILADEQVLGQALGLHGRICRRQGKFKEARASLADAIARHTWVLGINERSPDDLTEKARDEAEIKRLPDR